MKYTLLVYLLESFTLRVELLIFAQPFNAIFKKSLALNVGSFVMFMADGGNDVEHSCHPLCLALAIFAAENESSSLFTLQF